MALPDVVADFARSEGWTDPGERAAILSLAPSVRGQATLEVAERVAACD